MSELDSYLSNQNQRAKRKNELLQDIVAVITSLEQASKNKSGEALEMFEATKANLNEFHRNIQIMIEPSRDKTRFDEFYRLCIDIVENIKYYLEIIMAGFDFPIKNAILPYSRELVQLSERIISC